MIITVEELRRYINTDEEEQALAGRLQALELLIRGYTNNNFQVRGLHCECDISGKTFISETFTPFEVGDTVQVSGSSKNNGLYTVEAVTDTTFTVNEKTYDDIDVYVTKVEYPADVKMGVVNLLRWELNNRDKVGVQSESISRHSVTYYNMDGDNSIMGYPKSLMGFLRPYMKARFGRGIGV
jgi:hypothetical protein